MSATFNLSKNDQWETPPDLFQLGCDYFDFEPTLDLCATNFDKKCKLFMAKLKFYTLREGFISGKMEKGQKTQLLIQVVLFSGEKNEI